MRNLTRIGSAALALLLLSGMVAACGKAPPAESTALTETTAAPVPTEPPASESAEALPPEPTGPELLYNGILLPEAWPPNDGDPKDSSVKEIPYLLDPDEGGNHPDVVDIDVGRQLFVDDFLIERTSLTFTPHKAEPYAGNPLFVYSGNTFRTKHGGIFYNAEKERYDLFWNSGSNLMYLASEDGIEWFTPAAFSVLDFGVSGAYGSVVYNSTPDENNPRYLCVIRYANGKWEEITRAFGEKFDPEHLPTDIYYSSNGMGWKRLTSDGPTCGDATTVIYNPFRERYIFSLRRSYSYVGRARDYAECADILSIKDFSALDTVFWLRADEADLRDPDYPDFTPELYSVSAVAYESIMLGAFQIYLGPSNEDANATGIPKVTNINLAFSRDGFHYSRADREPIIESSKQAGAWDRGYLHQLNSVCVIVGDELRFYYSGFAGDETKAGQGTSGSMANAGLGYATMRRDGFVSLDGTGEVVTRLMRFDEVNDRLFINAKAKSIRAEIRDADGKVIPGFSLDECIPFSGDSTCEELKFTGGADLGALKGQDFSVRFVVEEGEFYAFWVSDTEDGESGGYTAGGYDGR